MHMVWFFTLPHCLKCFLHAHDLSLQFKTNNNPSDQKTQQKKSHLHIWHGHAASPSAQIVGLQWFLDPWTLVFHPALYISTSAKGKKTPCVKWFPTFKFICALLAAYKCSLKLRSHFCSPLDRFCGALQDCCIFQGCHGSRPYHPFG